MGTQRAAAVRALENFRQPQTQPRGPRHRRIVPLRLDVSARQSDGVDAGDIRRLCVRGIPRARRSDWRPASVAALAGHASQPGRRSDHRPGTRLVASDVCRVPRARVDSRHRHDHRPRRRDASQPPRMADRRVVAASVRCCVARRGMAVRGADDGQSAARAGRAVRDGDVAAARAARRTADSRVVGGGAVYRLRLQPTCPPPALGDQPRRSTLSPPAGQKDLALFRRVRRTVRPLAPPRQRPGDTAGDDCPPHVADQHRDEPARHSGRLRSRVHSRPRAGRTHGVDALDARGHGALRRPLLQLVRLTDPGAVDAEIHLLGGQRQPRGVVADDGERAAGTDASRRSRSRRVGARGGHRPRAAGASRRGSRQAATRPAASN